MSPARGSWRRPAWFAAASLVVASVVAVAVSAEGVPASPPSSGWTVYHGGYSGSGPSRLGRSIDTSRRAWTSSSLEGQIYTEPLVVNDDVYVATERDVVYALAASTGRVVWARRVATPVAASRLPCGDITPNVGVTGTPVIDPAHHQIFVVADAVIRGVVRHVLATLNTSTGAVERRVGVDPPGASPEALLQRTGLSLSAGRVVFAMGGNYGDCGSYRGRVEAVDERGRGRVIFTVDARRHQSQGAVWMGGAAPVVDSQGDVWVSSGNGSVHGPGTPYDDSDAVLELSSNLVLRQYFAPRNWYLNNARDLDLSTAPAFVGRRWIVASGKSDVAYLLRQSHLGGTGHEVRSLATGCHGPIDGGDAVVGNVVYLPCQGGPVALRVGGATGTLQVAWRADAGGGPPIVAAGEVWSLASSGVLYGLATRTGAVVQRANVGGSVNHFATPSVGDSLLIVATTSRVVAFRAAPIGTTR